MTFSKSIFLGLAAFSLAACKTTLPATSPSDVLLSDISTAEISGTSAARLLSTSSPTCLKFYENTAAFAALPTAELNGVPTPSFGGQLMKTLILGTLSGVASGGVSALGIESQFLESALIGTAGQVTYQAGSTVYDQIVGTGIPEPVVPSVPALSPMQEIEKAAAVLGCPAPDQAAIAGLNLSGG
jgi:hypothetical protein